MICRHCGVEIERGSESTDRLIRVSKAITPVMESWRTANGHFTCDTEKPVQWHQPLALTPAQMLADLRRIETDLR